MNDVTIQYRVTRITTTTTTTKREKEKTSVFVFFITHTLTNKETEKQTNEKRERNGTLVSTQWSSSTIRFGSSIWSSSSLSVVVVHIGVKWLLVELMRFLSSSANFSTSMGDFLRFHLDPRRSICIDHPIVPVVIASSSFVSFSLSVFHWSESMISSKQTFFTFTFTFTFTFSDDLSPRPAVVVVRLLTIDVSDRRSKCIRLFNHYWGSWWTMDEVSWDETFESKSSEIPPDCHADDADDGHSTMIDFHDWLNSNSTSDASLRV